MEGGEHPYDRTKHSRTPRPRPDVPTEGRHYDHRGAGLIRGAAGPFRSGMSRAQDHWRRRRSRPRDAARSMISFMADQTHPRLRVARKYFSNASLAQWASGPGISQACLRGSRKRSADMMMPLLPASSTHLASIAAGASASFAPPRMSATMLWTTTLAISSERYPVLDTPHGTSVLPGGAIATATPAA